MYWVLVVYYRLHLNRNLPPSSVFSWLHFSNWAKPTLVKSKQHNNSGCHDDQNQLALCEAWKNFPFLSLFLCCTHTCSVVSDGALHVDQGNCKLPNRNWKQSTEIYSNHIAAAETWRHNFSKNSWTWLSACVCWGRKWRAFGVGLHVVWFACPHVSVAAHSLPLPPSETSPLQPWISLTVGPLHDEQMNYLQVEQ